MNDDVEYLHDTPSDRWWRRFGHWVYMGICAFAIALVPSGFPAPKWAVGLLDWLPALHGFLTVSPNSGRFAIWVIVSTLAYPLMHLATRSRVYIRPRGAYGKSILAILFMDLVFVGGLSFDISSMRGNGMARLVIDSLTFGWARMIVVGPMLSMVYALLAFLNIHLINIVLFGLYRKR